MLLSLHQRIAIWRNDEIIENIEEDQGYFMAKVNHVDKRKFDKNLANVAPCTPTGFAYMPLQDAFYSLRINLTHGFTLDIEIMGERSYDTIQPTSWGYKFNDDV